MAHYGKENRKFNIFTMFLILSTIQISFIYADSTSIPTTVTTSIPTTVTTSNPTTIPTSITTTITTTSATTVTTESSTTVGSTSTTIIDTSSTDILSTSIIDTTNSTDTKNSTYTNRPKSSGGLSAGVIVAIVIPCAVALLGAGLAVYLCSRIPSTPPIQSNVVPPVIDSSMAKFGTTGINTVNNITEVPTPVKEVQVIQPQPVVQQHPIYPIKKEAPSDPQVNRVFQPLYPSQNAQAVPINQSVQSVSQVVPSPQASTKHIIIGSQSQLMAPKEISGLNNSTVIKNSIGGNISSSQISNQSQAVPIKILPIVDQGNI